MVARDVRISNSAGLKAKTAAVFVQKASEFESEVWIEKEERKANAKSLLGLLSLEIGNGASVRLLVSGGDEETAILELGDYLSNG